MGVDGRHVPGNEQSRVQLERFSTAIEALRTVA
jgi:hypothetical protein